MEKLLEALNENLNVEDGIYITDFEGKILFPVSLKDKHLTEIYPYKEIFKYFESKNFKKKEFLINSSINIFKVYVKPYQDFLFFKIKDITQEKYIEKIVNLLFSSFIHEVKTPLTNILGYLELINIPKEISEVLERNKIKLLKLLERSKLFAKLYSYKPKFEKIRLKTFIREILRNYEDQIKEKKLDLFLEIPEIDIQTDTLLFEIILDNLISNAINATSKGYILIFAEEEDDKIILGVKDTGSGLPSSISKRIFDPFFSTKGSLGLGLFLVRKACEYLNYKIELEKPSLGTCFKIIIPKFISPIEK